MRCPGRGLPAPDSSRVLQLKYGVYVCAPGACEPVSRRVSAPTTLHTHVSAFVQVCAHASTESVHLGARACVHVPACHQLSRGLILESIWRLTFVALDNDQRGFEAWTPPVLEYSASGLLTSKQAHICARGCRVWTQQPGGAEVVGQTAGATSQGAAASPALLTVLFCFWVSAALAAG